MPFPTGGLQKHRENLAQNDLRFSQDKDRAIENWVKEALKEVNTTNNNRNQAKIILNYLANMVWEAQGGVPLFQFDSNSNLPMSWNRPQDGEKNYIRYEIGHMISRNCGGGSNVENLCFQSARCNQHIQTSLSLNEVVEAYFSHNQIVLDRINALTALYQSETWQAKKIDLDALLT